MERNVQGVSMSRAETAKTSAKCHKRGRIPMADSLQSPTQATGTADAQNAQMQEAMTKSFKAMLDQVMSAAKSEINS
jgi:hypothetical protein